RHLDRRDPWPRHAPITRLVARMILTISHDILGPVWVVLQEWHSADEVHAGAEHHEHRPPVAVAHQPRAHLVPTTHGTARWNASVVAMAEPHLTARPAGNALGDGRAAVLLERGRVEHAVGDALALLALSDALADFLGMKLQTHIRLARPHPVPFPITDHAPAWQHLPVDGLVILDDDPPTNRERRGRAPVHGAEPQPLRRDSERLDDVPLAFPAVEKRAEGDAPVTVEPCPDELLRARGPQPLLVRLNVDVLVIVDLRRD